MSNLAGKVAVITGGNSGIGYASAELLKLQGAQVIIIGRSAEKVAKASTNLGVIGLVADVSKVSQIEKVANEVKEKFGKIDILFVNAGVYQYSPVGATTEEMFDYQVDINFKGAFFTLEHFIPLLKEGASVINLSSIAAFMGMPSGSVYSATKAALNALTKTYARELAPQKIRVNSINPGPIATPIFEKTGMAEEQLGEVASSMGKVIPLGRFGQPDDIAKLVAFLASDDASFISGGEYSVDGGLGVNSIMFD